MDKAKQLPIEHTHKQLQKNCSKFPGILVKLLLGIPINTRLSEKKQTEKKNRKLALFRTDDRFVVSFYLLAAAFPNPSLHRYWVELL